ncbi:ABC transporter permease [Terrimonas pollutisoli]|uniref:ABC transporter permease n=1 Tax=Terrimonas pollutisoli TaxID=3034147 RepID=UPI0023EA9FDF|nr:ABC transporter permease [Terrimonas sp. H1YJ31]
MIKNYLVVAWRNLLRYKVYSFINIAGLAIGLAVCMLIVLYAGHEASYDRFHKNAERIFWLQTKLKIGTDSVFMPYLNYSAAPMVSQREPAVESYLRLRKDPQNAIIQNPAIPSLKFAESKFIFADSNFFSFFSFKLLQGSKEQVLRNPLSVVISRDAAKKYFGNDDPVGKIIRYNNNDDLLITGVAANAPSNSTIEFDFVASLSSMRAIKEQQSLVLKEKNDFTTYFLVKPGGQISRIEAALFQLAKMQGNDEEFSFRYVSTPLTKLHKVASTDISGFKYVKIFPFVAALVLLLALINYMSLSTARSAIRAKEIGVRKVMGAGRKIIASQFFIESALYTGIAFILGYFLCIFFQPFFFNFLQISIDRSFLLHPWVIVAFSALFMVTILISATYPSLLLSAYKPVSVLYGKLGKSGGISVRKFFTIIQFAIAVAFIICGIVMQRQLLFFRHKDTGMNRDNIVMMPFGTGVTKHYAAFKQELRSVPGIQQFSLALHPLFKGYDMMGMMPPGSKEMVLMPVMDVDQHFIPLLGLQWKLRPDESFFYKKKNSIILNETAVERLHLGQQPVNQKIDQFEVAGVLKDFNWSSLQHKIEGLILSVSNDEDSTSMWAAKGGCLFAKINGGTNIPSLMDQMKNLHKKYDSEKAFEYYFLDDAFNELYKAEERLSQMLMLFTGLAIFIACLGLFGLVTFMAIQRTKEIGIRKTLGASVQNIVSLLSGEFMVLVLLAVIIASPVAWYFMNKWLEEFAYRVSIVWWVFLLAAIITMLIALMTIGFQAIKAAIANPVKSLRTE